ncbi:Myotubularin protein [Carpediemonas membranifera]|uniref:Myotubularin protein n=1 Tax=Carpediemonas membranifera TaxID=201153 RepID=A0A8J6B837_9EUKA|nr:Myotubularin protein [Carpediemonas membranifera]|eukprot:KAG9395114.1 Myotubularin protein [Carpediemonas membranifera]
MAVDAVELAQSNAFIEPQGSTLEVFQVQYELDQDTTFIVPSGTDSDSLFQFFSKLIRKIHRPDGIVYHPREIVAAKQIFLAQSGRETFAFALNQNRARPDNPLCYETQGFLQLGYLMSICFDAIESQEGTLTSFKDGKVLMNMAATYYTEDRDGRIYLSAVLQNHRIWASMRFWTETFFDSLSTELNHVPSPGDRWAEMDESSQVSMSVLESNIKFAQLHAFLLLMQDLSVPSENISSFASRMALLLALNEEITAQLHQMVAVRRETLLAQREEHRVQCDALLQKFRVVCRQFDRAAAKVRRMLADSVEGTAFDRDRVEPFMAANTPLSARPVVSGVPRDTRGSPDSLGVMEKLVSINVHQTPKIAAAEGIESSAESRTSELGDSVLSSLGVDAYDYGRGKSLATEGYSF